MKHIKSILAASVLAAMIVGTAMASERLDVRDIRAVARSLELGEVQGLHARFTPTMAAAVSPEQLSGIWKQVESSAGPLKSIEVINGKPGDAQQAARLHFERATLKMLLTINADNQVEGLYLVPDTAPVAAVATNDPFTTEDLKFSAPAAPTLNATLTLPKGVNNPPAVVLVHGSGPHDRYETLAGIRPFLDLARGLAGQGIAVLAYDKRTFTHGKDLDLSTLTLDQESTDDAIAAAEWLMKSGKVDPQRVFVLGHSQGGMVTPRILLRDSKIRGGILLAAPAVKLLDLLPRQNQELLGAQVDSDAGKKHMAAINDAIRTIRSPASAGSDKVFNLPVSYWRSVDAVDPVADALKVRQPLLILQGGKDFQVAKPDWQGWQPVTAKHGKTMQFKLYPELNHLAVVSQNKPGLEDYNEPRHVDPQLIKDIASWVKKQ